MATPQIEVTVPASARNVAVVRTMAGDMAAAVDLPYDRFEDLVLAVDELATLLLATEPGAVRCRFSRDGVGVGVEMTALGSTHAAAFDELAEIVLAGVTVDLQLLLHDDPPHGAFTVLAGV